MKKILLVCSLLIVTSALAQPLDRSNFHIWLYDEFDYVDKITPLSGSLGTTTNGKLFTDVWHDHNTDGWGEPQDYSNPAAVTLPGGSIVRLNETLIPGGGATIGGKYRTHESGMIMLKDLYFSYGILEARMKFPRDPDHVRDNSALASFWTCCNNSEIDVFDVSFYTGTLNHRTYDQVYYNKNIYVDAYQVTEITSGTVSDLSAAFHTFSCKWSPSSVSYYLDDIWLSTIYYREARTYDIGTGMQIAIGGGNSTTPSGQQLDIDWIKVWEQNCIPNEVTVNDITEPVFHERVHQELHKHEKITLSTPSSSVCMIRKSNGTIFESEATTITANFIADESAPLWGPVSVPTSPKFGVSTNYSGQYVYSNGFFVIRPHKCEDKDMNGCIKNPIEGEKLICATDVLYYYTNSTPGGIWSTDRSDVVIDPYTGVITGFASYTVSGPVTIIYTVGECIVTYNVIVYICEKQGEHRAAIDKDKEHPYNNYSELAFTEQTETSLTSGNAPISNKISKGDKNTLIKVYPNPAQNTITISYPCKSAGQLEINIKDVAGRVRLTESVRCDEGAGIEHEVDISAFASGVYTVDLTLNNQHVVKKIVKL